jgi:hypothetical protein
MLLIPEDRVFYFIKFSIEALEQDLRDCVDERKSVLYRLYSEVDSSIKGVDQIEWYKQAKELFLRDKLHPKKIQTRMHFDASMASVPAIHINLPGEQAINDGIGVDKGYMPGSYDEPGNYQHTHTRGFQTNFNIVITSDNEIETLILYHTIRASFISMMDYLEIWGLRNIKLSGGDLQFNPEFVPPHLFIRYIGLNFFYEVDVPSFLRDRIVDINKVFFEGTIKEN